VNPFLGDSTAGQGCLTAGRTENPDSRDLLIPVGPQALSAQIPDHSTVRTGTTGFCDSTTLRPLLKTPWAAKHQRHEPSNQTGLIATAAGKLAERGPGQFVADPAADILSESDHTLNGIVIRKSLHNNET